jgi:hypothetical protein
MNGFRETAKAVAGILLAKMSAARSEVYVDRLSPSRKYRSFNFGLVNASNRPEADHQVCRVNGRIAPRNGRSSLSSVDLFGSRDSPTSGSDDFDSGSNGLVRHLAKSCYLAEMGL